MKRLLFAAVLGAIAIASPALADGHADEGAHAALAEAVAAKWRDVDRERDQYRHPVETIEFFQIEPGMTVVDYAPPPGWYTRILVPYLGTDGTYVAAIRTFDAASPASQARQRVFPEVFPRLLREEIEKSSIKNVAKIEGLNTLYIPEETHGTVDRVLVFRMLHNLHRWGLAHEELSNFRKLLKDDGMLGIVQHRAGTDAPYSYADGNKGYMRQEDVVKLVEAHGFELVGASEINANPKDTADYEGGVWQLPPVWASKDEALKEIGESDRMTLLFKKRR